MRLHRRPGATPRLTPLLCTGAMLLTGTVLVLWAGPSAVPYRTLAGPGHGRGLSQFGAFDNAAAGWSAEQILDHYYPGATLGTIPRTTVRVRLAAQDGAVLDTYADTGLLVAGRTLEPGQAAHLTPLPGGRANVVVTAGCGGEVLWQESTDDPWAYPISRDPNRPAAEHLQLCGGGGYRGALGVTLDGDEARTVNLVEVDDYLRGVVPAEVQPNWADQGGAEALRAQAVAARSYALAENRHPYAQTCDTTDCQVYPGTAKEDPRTSAAVDSTTGLVLLRDGRILRSEYSAAPGGGEPADITTFAVGPAPGELVPAEPEAPDPRTPAPETVIDAEYRRIGGPSSPVGRPLGPEMLLPDHAGTYRMFTNGVIIATPTLGPQVVDFTTLLTLIPGPATGTTPETDAPQANSPQPGTAPNTPTPNATVPNGARNGAVPDPGTTPNIPAPNATVPDGARNGAVPHPGPAPEDAAPQSGSLPPANGTPPRPAAPNPSPGGTSAPENTAPQDNSTPGHSPNEVPPAAPKPPGDPTSPDNPAPLPNSEPLTTPLPNPTAEDTLTHPNPITARTPASHTATAPPTPLGPQEGPPPPPATVAPSTASTPTPPPTQLPAMPANRTPTH